MNYNDSRRAAYLLFKKLRLNWIFNTSSFTGNLIIALIITYFFRMRGHGDEVDYVFFLTIMAIGLWITEAIPPFAVGIFLVAMLVFGFGSDLLFDGTSDVNIYVDTWTSNVIWLLLGGFFLARAMSVVALDRQLLQFTVKRFGSNSQRLLLGIMLTTAVVSFAMSNTATTAMMISSVMPLAISLGKESPFTKALLVGVPAAASFGGMGTIIASPPNAIAVGALGEMGIHISFVEWMFVGVPVALLLIYVFWVFLIRRYKIKGITIDLNLFEGKTNKVNPTHRRVVIITFIITVGLWMSEPLHGIPLAATSAIPIVLLTMTQVITAEDVRTLPWDTLMLVAGGLALGIALVDMKLSEILMDRVLSLALPLVLVAMVFSLIGVLLSNIMSNTAAAAILVPLAITLPEPFGLALPVILAICCSSALMLPVSTPSNAISFATGMIKQKEFYAGGLLLIFIAPPIAQLAVLLWSLLY